VLEILKELPRGIEGLKASGKVTKEDYEKVLEPLLEEARREGRPIRFLYQFGPEFEGITPGAAWEDAKVGLQFLRLFDGCAIVSDVGWIRESVRLMGFMMPCPVRVFGNHERDQAVEWLGSIPEGPAISHRMIAESGVLVVEVKEALRAQDFDALAVAADTWIEAHGNLHGLVIHTREFPGWENLSGLLKHIRFVRDHHRKIEKVALAADSKLANLAPHIAEHFVKAEVKGFGYDELESAIAWASGASGKGTTPPATEEKKT